MIVIMVLAMLFAGQPQGAAAARRLTMLPAGTCVLLHLRLLGDPQDSSAALLQLVLALCTDRSPPPPTSASQPPSTTIMPPPSSATPTTTQTTTAPTSQTAPSAHAGEAPAHPPPAALGGPDTPPLASTDGSTTSAAPSSSTVRTTGQAGHVAVGPWTAKPGDPPFPADPVGQAGRWALTMALLLLAFAAMIRLLWTRRPPRDEE